MGRPSLPDERRRTIRIQVRLTPDEEALLTDQATRNGLTLSDYIRQAAIGSKPRLQMANSQQAVLIRQLGNLGKITGNISRIISQYYQIEQGGQELWEVAQTARQGVQSLSSYLIPLITNSDFHLEPESWEKLVTGFNELEKIGTDLNKVAKAMNSQSISRQDQRVSGDRVAAPLYGMQTITRNIIQILNHGAERRD